MADEKAFLTRMQWAFVVLGLSAFAVARVSGAVQPALLYLIAGVFWSMFMLLIAAVVIHEFWPTRRTPRKGLKWKALAAAPFVGAVLAISIAGGFASVLVAVGQAALWVRAPATSANLVVWLAMPVTLIVGLLAFWIRLRLRLFYGITETGVGLVVALLQVKGVSGELLSGSFVLPFITAALYLVVRGLDNAYQGWNADPPDPLAKVLKEARTTQAESPK